MRGDAWGKLMDAEPRAYGVGHGIVCPDGEHDAKGEGCANEPLVDYADKHQAREGERRVERAKNRYGNVAHVGTGCEYVPGRAGGKEQEQNDDKAPQAIPIGREREQYRSGKPYTLVGHATAHARDSEELGAAEPPHGADHKRCCDGPYVEADENHNGVDGARRGAREEALRPPAGSLACKSTSSTLRLLGIAPVFELVYVAVDANAFALVLPSLGALLTQRSVTPPNRRCLP